MAPRARTHRTWGSVTAQVSTYVILGMGEDPLSPTGRRFLVRFVGSGHVSSVEQQRCYVGRRASSPQRRPAKPMS